MHNILKTNSAYSSSDSIVAVPLLYFPQKFDSTLNSCIVYQPYHFHFFLVIFYCIVKTCTRKWLCISGFMSKEFDITEMIFLGQLASCTFFSWTTSARLYCFQYEEKIFTFEPRHEKTCLKPYANNKDADQPAHSRSLISTFVVHCLDNIIPILSKAKISRLYLASVAELSRPVWVLPDQKPLRQIFSWQGSFIFHHSPCFLATGSPMLSIARRPLMTNVQVVCDGQPYFKPRGCRNVWN